jgi:SAM-dependent methyltransferase
VDAEAQRQARLENWAAMAPGWERVREERERIAAPVTDWLVRELAPQEGESILELAAGQGDVGNEVAPLLGETGRLISTDFSPAMIEIAQSRSFVLGLTNVEHRVIDAEDIELEDAFVDGVICRWGYMLMPNPGTALAETRRVLRTGGRLVFAVWGSADRNPWISLGVRVLMGRGLVPPPEPGEPGMFVLADEGELRQLVVAAGFTTVRMDEVPVRNVYENVDDYVSRANETGGMFARAWSTATEGEHEEIKDEFRDAFAPFATDDGYELPGVAVCAFAS